MADETTKKPRNVAKKTIVMQMEYELVVPDPPYGSVEAAENGGKFTYSTIGVAWKEMTGEDFGDNPGAPVLGVDVDLVVTFKDTAAAKKRLKEALESGKISGGTFRVAACGKSITPTIKAKQTNEVTL